MSIGRLLSGESTFLVGVEEHGDGGLRLYLNHRSLGLYTLVYGEDVKAQVLAAWNGGGGFITVPTPPAECVHQEARP